MRRPKIFVSHSSKTAENLEFLGKICDALEQEDSGEGFKVLVDRNIRPNDEWFPRIHEWLYECDAVVILLSADALKSAWVQAESMVMSVRRRKEADFRLIVIPMDNIDDSRVKKHRIFGNPVRLQDFQFIRDCKNELEMISKINDALVTLRPQSSPFETLVRKIRQTLVGVENDVLDDALLRLTCNHFPDKWDGCCRADRLARTLFREPSQALSNLRVLLEESAHVIRQDKAKTLLDMLKGLWVKAEAAANLIEARDNKQFIAINSNHLGDFTGNCYARRAWPFPQKVNTITVDVNSRFDQIESILLETIGKSATKVSRQVQRLKETRDPILLMFTLPESSPDNTVKSDFPDEQLLESIKYKYPNVTILLATGNETLESLHYVMHLQPPLDMDEEERQCSSFEEVMGYINDTLR